MFSLGNRASKQAQREALADQNGVDADDLLDPSARVFERSPEEKSLVRRLDIFLMTFGCISQVIKYLDQQNISTAYVSGMKEDLNLFGNELNFFTTYFNVGYCIMLMPSQAIITRVRPSLWLSSLEILWGMITALVAMTTHAKQIYALRFFLGLLESSAYPGMIFLMMAWYTPPELAKRVGFYHSCQAIGSMMSGAIQVAITETLDGKGGLAGWRYLFIINGVMTIALGLFGYFMLPDLPNKLNPMSFWFKKSHGDIAMMRYVRHKRAEPKPMTIGTVKKVFSGWLVYAFMALYVGIVLAASGNSYVNLWLKSLKTASGAALFNSNKINSITIGGNGIIVLFVWIWALTADLIHSRWIVVLIQACIGLIPAIILSIWNVSMGAKWFAMFIQYVSMGTAPPLFAWLSDMCPHDAEARALIVGFTISMYYAISAWSQVLIWPASKAPHYPFAYEVSIGLWCFIILLLITVRWMDVNIIRPQNARISAEKAAAAATNGKETALFDDEKKENVLTPSVAVLAVQMVTGS